MKKALDYKAIQKAAHALRGTTEAERNAFLTALAHELKRNTKTILAANVRDVKSAERARLPIPLLERLVFSTQDLEHATARVMSVRKLQSGLGEVIEKKLMGNGLTLKKVRVPLGVLAVIYESRPEVTVDVAALSVKSGNAVILKGGSEALETNKALYACIRSALKKSKLPEHAVAFIATGDRAVTNELLTRHDAVDLVIARGSYAMVKAVMEHSKIPVLAHSAGGARIYVDKSADLDMAILVLVNAKITKPAACNSVDTVLVHRAVAKKLIPRLTKAMEEKGVEVKRTMDWDEETLRMTVGIKIVASFDEALAFIEKHSKRHTEGVIARDHSVINRFVRTVDAAALFVNASTRLHDGYVFGLGAEMGISTARLQARGPVGLKELTTYMWEVYGTGNTR